MTLAQEDEATGSKQVSLDSKMVTPISYFKPGLLIFLYSLSFSVSIPAFPAITLQVCDGNTKLSSYYYGIGMTIRYVAETFCAPLLGTLADSAGRRPVLLISYLSVVLETTVMALAPSIEALFACRMITGMADSGIATAYTIFSDIATHNKDNLTVTFGYIAAVVITSFSVGPLIGGIINDKVSPMACLLVSAGLTLSAFLLAFLFLEESLHYNGVNYSDKLIYLRTGKRPKNGNAPPEGVESGAGEVPASDGTYGDLHPTTSGASGSGISLKVPTRESDLARSVTDASSGSITDAEVCEAIYDSEDDADSTDGAVQSKPACDCCKTFCPNCISESKTLSWFGRFLEISNPFPAMKKNLRNKKMRQLITPIFVSATASGGLISVWYMYMTDRYNASSTDIGMYLAAMSVVTALVQGFLLKRIVPHCLSEKRAVVVGYFLVSLQFMVIAWAPNFTMLFLSLPFVVGSIVDPTLKGLVVKQSMIGETKTESVSKQGNLQGTLSATNTLGGAIGSIVISQIFSWSVGLKHPLPWLAFAICGTVGLLCGVYMLHVFSTKEWKSASRSSRLSTDAPEGRPLTEEDFVPDDEEPHDGLDEANVASKPLLSEA